MQAVHENHQFYSPVTNWKSKNRRRQRYLNINTQKKVKPSEIKSPRLSKSLNSITTSSTTTSQSTSLPILPRSQSLKHHNSSNNLPIAKSKPIIPSSNKKIQITSNIEKNVEKVNNVKTGLNVNNTSFSQHVTEAKKEIITSPTVHFKDCNNFGHAKKKSDSSSVLFRSRSLKERASRISNNNISDVSTLVDSVGNESFCSYFSKSNKSPVDNAANESFCSYFSKGHKSPINNAANESFCSYFSKGHKSPRMKSPQLSISSSNSTACFSPTLSSTSQEIDRETSFTTVCNSPSVDNSLLSMSNDQLFKLLPKKIIKALENYTAQNGTTEISYKKGDFFFVISENESYYFVTNPSTKSSGFVSKYSFEQVDNFIKMNKMKSVLSPIVEKKENILHKEYDPLSDRIMTICITDDILSENTQSIFPIEISKIDGTVAVLNRSYDDVCQLHNSLLECFSEYSGSNDKERILPFLPSLDAIFNHPRKSPRQILSNYLQMLIQLPNEIQFSYPFEQFFSIRKDDILSSIYVVSDLQFFTIKDIKDSKHTVKVKVIADNKDLKKSEINVLYVTPNIKYFDLFDTIEAKFNTTFTNLYYQNEYNEKVKVFGDKDLKLFFNSNNLSYVLWAK